MDDLKFRHLRADEIEVRASMTSYEKDARGNKDKTKPLKVCVLLYKDARCDMALLDEVVGPMNWQRKHEIKENVINGVKTMINYCAVSIYDERKMAWVEKMDCGTESNTESVKGESSDAFKRACICWGIGRSLYTAPQNMWIDLTDEEKKDLAYFKLKCKEIGYADNGNINRLVLVDKYGNVRYEYPKTKKDPTTGTTTPTTPINPLPTVPTVPQTSNPATKQDKAQENEENDGYNWTIAHANVAAIPTFDAARKWLVDNGYPMPITTHVEKDPSEQKLVNEICEMLKKKRK